MADWLRGPAAKNGVARRVAIGRLNENNANRRIVALWRGVITP
jgi:hypothetical protein